MSSAVGSDPALARAGALSARNFALGAAALSIVLGGFWLWQQGEWRHAALELVGAAEPVRSVPASFFVQRVEPVLEKHCTACHGPDKVRGSWRADSFRHVMLTGTSSDNIVPGDAEHSQLIARLMLPESDIRAMPPAGYDRLEGDEIALLRMWVEAGASGSALPAAFPDAPPPIKEISLADVDPAKVERLRAPLAAAVTKFSEAYPFTLTYISRSAQYLRLSDASHVFSDTDLTESVAFAGAITSLNLQRSPVSGASSRALARMGAVEDVVLLSDTISASDVTKLVAGWPRLKSLTISEQSVSDALHELSTKRGFRLYVRQ